MAGDEIRISASTALMAISGSGAGNGRNTPGGDLNRKPRPAHVEEEPDASETPAPPESAGLGTTLDLIV